MLPGGPGRVKAVREHNHDCTELHSPGTPRHGSITLPGTIRAGQDTIRPRAYGGSRDTSHRYERGLHGRYHPGRTSPGDPHAARDEPGGPGTPVRRLGRDDPQHGAGRRDEAPRADAAQASLGAQSGHHDPHAPGPARGARPRPSRALGRRAGRAIRGTARRRRAGDTGRDTRGTGRVHSRHRREPVLAGPDGAAGTDPRRPVPRPGGAVGPVGCLQHGGVAADADAPVLRRGGRRTARARCRPRPPARRLACRDAGMVPAAAGTARRGRRAGRAVGGRPASPPGCRGRRPGSWLPGGSSCCT